MRGRRRIAVVGLLAISALGAMTSTAGAQSASPWTVQANGGFVSLSLLNTVQVSGGGSEADASSAPMAEASGTGACLSTAASMNPCPTSASSSLAGDALDSTQEAVAQGNGTTATPRGANNCPLPIKTGLLDVDVLCGNASASEDASGNPTAAGTGSIASAALSLSLNDVLEAILGGALPSASSLCADAPAATTSPGSNSSPLSGPVQSLLGSVNGILPANLALNATSVAGGGDLAGECSILSGLLTQLGAAGGSSPVTSVLTGILNQVLGLTGGDASSVQPLAITLGGSTTSVSTSGNVVTDSVTQRSLEVNLFGLADLQVAPTTAAVALDRSTGTVTPTCNAGVVSYSTNGALPTFVSITQVDDLVNQVLQTLGSTGTALSGALSTLLSDVLTYDPSGNLLTCNTSAPGTTASAKVGVVNLGLLRGLMGGLTLDVGDVSVTGNSTAPAPAVATSPSSAQPVASSPAAVPNVTSVHTGEYWAGSLPIIVMIAMGLAGLVLIGRRRVLAFTRSLFTLARRRDAQ
jgi:hypothetical protein